jgi:FMN phosphatase YigB (HAD superfamily)
LLLFHVQVHGHKIDFDDWHAAVHHTLDYQQLLHEDPALRQLLFNIGAERHLLTNADALHAGKCLQRLGLEGCFQVGTRVQVISVSKPTRWWHMAATAARQSGYLASL